MNPLLLNELSSESSLPQYLQIYHQFRQLILDGKLLPGERLPATRSFAAEIGVSRNTIKAAYEQLQSEGYVETSRGGGTRVCQGLPKPLSGERSDTLTQGKDAVSLSDAAERMLGSYRTLNRKSNLLLSPGRPAFDLFPRSAWARSVSKAAKEMELFNSDPDGAGHPLLRREIAEHLRKTRGVLADESNIFVFNGSQQALDYCFKLLLNEGDDVAIESPGFPGLDGALRMQNAKLSYLLADKDGFPVEQLIEQNRRYRAVLLTPSRNFPLGYTLSLARRLKLLDWADTAGSWIIEDDYDSDYVFDDQPITAMQGLRSSSRVIYAGTFSRSMFPSIRLGYLVVPDVLKGSFSQLRRFYDGGVSVLPQLAMGHFMSSGAFARHQRQLRATYRDKRELLDRLMAEAQIQGLSKAVGASGGMHSVFPLDHAIDGQLLVAECLSEGLGIKALSEYFADSAPFDALILGYAGYNSDQLERGVGMLNDVMAKFPLSRC